MQCYEGKYKDYAMLTGLAAFVYAAGVPIGFLYLVYKFKDRDRKVQKALGCGAAGDACANGTARASKNGSEKRVVNPDKTHQRLMTTRARLFSLRASQ